MAKWNVFGEQSKAKDMELKGHTDSVDQLCWDPKHGDLLATASGDKTVRLWDARSEYSWLMCFPSLLFPGCISQRIISLLQTTTFKWFLFQLYSLLSNYNVAERSFSPPVLYVSFQGSARHRKKIQL
jgi:WD40 repeat protein